MYVFRIAVADPTVPLVIFLADPTLLVLLCPWKPGLSWAWRCGCLIPSCLLLQLLKLRSQEALRICSRLLERSIGPLFTVTTTLLLLLLTIGNGPSGLEVVLAMFRSFSGVWQCPISSSVERESGRSVGENLWGKNLFSPWILVKAARKVLSNNHPYHLQLFERSKYWYMSPTECVAWMRSQQERIILDMRQ